VQLFQHHAANQTWMQPWRHLLFSTSMSPSTSNASQKSQQTPQSEKDQSENKIAANGNQPSTQSNDRSTARPLTLRQSLATPAITAPTEISTPRPMCDEIKEIEHVWVPMPDGVRLGARIWLPDTAGPSNRVPGNSMQLFNLIISQRFLSLCRMESATERRIAMKRISFT
jgi:hypothetical protein